jgi:hypothetical protein
MRYPGFAKAVAVVGSGLMRNLGVDPYADTRKNNRSE